MWRQDSELQAMLRDSAQVFLRGEHDMARHRAARRMEQGFDPALWRRMAQMGWTGMLVPEERGGAGLGLSHAATMASVFGGVLLPEPFIEAAVMGGAALAAAEKDGGLGASLSAGATVVTVAWQEWAGQSPAEQPRASLVRDGAGWRLDGEKLFVPGVVPDGVLLVTAMAAEEPVLVSVPVGTVGVETEPCRQTDGSVLTRVGFSGVTLTDDAVLARGAAAEKAIGAALAAGLVALCAALEGLAAAALAMTVTYLGQRVQFGQTLASFQVLRHRVVNLHQEVELAGASWRRALQEVEANPGAPRAKLALGAAKARCGDAALEAGRTALQLHGAFGYTEEADVGLFLNTALRWSAWLGTPDLHRRLALEAHREGNHHAA